MAGKARFRIVLTMGTLAGCHCGNRFRSIRTIGGLRIGIRGDHLMA
jgi:hypothetical protein